MMWLESADLRSTKSTGENMLTTSFLPNHLTLAGKFPFRRTAAQSRNASMPRCLVPALSLAAILLASGTHDAIAQDAYLSAQDTRCWLASRTYSKGIVIMSADGALVCNAQGHWEATSSAVTGCISGSDFYGVGATMQRFANSPISVCSEDGTWRDRRQDD